MDILNEHNEWQEVYATLRESSEESNIKYKIITIRLPSQCAEYEKVYHYTRNNCHYCTFYKRHRSTT